MSDIMRKKFGVQPISALENITLLIKEENVWRFAGQVCDVPSRRPSATDIDELGEIWVCL